MRKIAIVAAFVFVTFVGSTPVWADPFFDAGSSINEDVLVGVGTDVTIDF